MSKDSIVITALKIFGRFGIKNVSMSQIASAVHVSKRTLYSYFGSKDELLYACMKYDWENVSEILYIVENQYENAMKTVIMLSDKVYQYRVSYCPAFYKDIVQFDDANLKLKEIYDRIRQRFGEYFNRGVEEGLFQSQRNYEVMSFILVEQMILQSRVNMSHRTTIYFTFLRGLCTDEGMRVLDGLSRRKEEVFDYEYELNK